MDWITDNIAIGNFQDARKGYAAVDAILCLKEDCICKGREDVDAFRVPLIDGPGNTRKSIEEAIDVIAGVVSSGEKILVHCHAGRSRSVCIVAAYFVRHHNMTVKEALDFVGGKRWYSLSIGIEEVLSVPVGGCCR